MFAAERDQPPTGPEIEQRSHAIIDRRLARCAWPDAATRSVVRRVIHANADFSFAESLRIHPEAVSRGVAALRAGSPVICDVQMVRQGITKCGPQALCAIREPAVAELAKANGTTRSAAAMEHFRDRLDGAVVAVGNAPTALWKLIAMAHEENGPRPALVVGMPVGFVGALESKLALTRSDLCYITNVSPRGGSPAAAAVMNALGLLASSSE
ncbi:MAG: precorrin-8X methylmutase [Victivallales bacterium]|nr:precorrin-8X methylmutase [Victivallales bacterium]